LSDLSAVEKLTIEKLLGMSSGYVLDFSNRTFQGFVADSVGRDIYDSVYDYASGSKANRLRALWKIEPNDIVGKLLVDLLSYVYHVSAEDPDERLLDECQAITERLLQGTSMPSTKPLIFVSYARPDLEGAKAIVDLLSHAGFHTWFDKKDLKGGQDWEYEIRRQIGAASLVLICLSTNTVDRKGFFHKEMRYAVDEALKLPKGKVYIMPVRLNDCAIPDDLRQWHALELFAPSASRHLLSSIGNALDCGARVDAKAHESFALAMSKINSEEKKAKGSQDDLRSTPSLAAGLDSAAREAIMLLGDNGPLLVENDHLYAVSGIDYEEVRSDVGTAAIARALQELTLRVPALVETIEVAAPLPQDGPYDPNWDTVAAEGLTAEGWNVYAHIKSV